MLKRCTLAFCIGIAAPVYGAVTDALSEQERQDPPTRSEIEQVAYSGGALPEGQSALTVKVQVLLDRAGISPGVVDGYKGGMSESALLAFESRAGLPVDGLLDPEVWAALGGDTAAPVLQDYTITEEDVAGLSAPLPEDYAQMAELDRLGFTSVAEKLAERFHMDEDFLADLNPGARYMAGDTIVVADPGAPVAGEVVRIEVDKRARRLIAYDARGAVLVNNPVAVGSTHTPSPSGMVEVQAVAIEPTYTYNPDVNFKQGDNDKVLILPPGANGPVGLVWIDLSKPTYGLHGTPDPARLFVERSHGCVRMTNWDAQELAEMVREGTVVEFLE